MDKKQLLKGMLVRLIIGGCLTVALFIWVEISPGFEGLVYLIFSCVGAWRLGTLLGDTFDDYIDEQLPTLFCKNKHE